MISLNDKVGMAVHTNNVFFFFLVQKIWLVSLLCVWKFIEWQWNKIEDQGTNTPYNGLLFHIMKYWNVFFMCCITIYIGKGETSVPMF